MRKAGNVLVMFVDADAVVHRGGELNQLARNQVGWNENGAVFDVRDDDAGAGGGYELRCHWHDVSQSRNRLHPSQRSKLDSPAPIRLEVVFERALCEDGADDNFKRVAGNRVSCAVQNLQRGVVL